jgi:hypothetical protein
VIAKMNELLEKAYNCYLVYLDNLNYGNVTQNDCLLYDAILTIANNIQEEQYIQYFVANLFCGNKYPLTITSDMNRLIAWTLNESETVSNTFDWHLINAPTNVTYPIQTNSEVGFRYFYLSIPQGSNFTVTNELNMQLYDSALPKENLNQIFTFVGTATMENGQVNNIYRKDDVYNATNSVLFKVGLS